MTHFKNYLNLSLTVIDVSVFFPFAEYGMSCCVLNDKLYMVGGQTSRTDVFNLITGEWHRTKDCNTKRMEAQVKRYGPYCMMALTSSKFTAHYKNYNILFSLDGKLYIFGGYDYTNGHYHDSIEVFDPTIQKWKTIKQTLPQPLRSFGLCLLKDLILIDRK